MADNMRLRKLGDKAAAMGSMMVRPQSSEAAGLQAKQQIINQYNNANDPMEEIPPVSQPAQEVDKLDPNAVYGTRKGEQRIDVAPMLRPLGSGYVDPSLVKMKPMYDDGGTVPDSNNLPQEAFDLNAASVVGDSAVDSAAQAVPESGMHKAEDAAKSVGNAMDDPSSMPGQGAQTRQYGIQGLNRNYMVPMMDDGGVVKTGMIKLSPTPEPELNKTSVEGMTPLLHESVKMDMMRNADLYPKSTDPNQSSDVIDPEELTKYNQNKAPKMKPMYDDGGPVYMDPNDGHHQEAVLEEGERVLTPEQNKQYETEHGAPADFGGRVMQQPNPPVKPMLDTERESDQPVGGAKMDVSNPPDAKVGGGEPAMMRTMSATNAPKMAPVGQPHDAAPAAVSGGAPGTQQVQQPEANPLSHEGPALPSDHDKFQQEKSALKQKMADAAEGKFNNGKFDHIAYGEAKMALADLEKANPYGSTANHPGMGGKILRGLATAGEIASDVVLGPGITERIPGTQENLRAEEARGQQQITQGLGQQATEAETGLHKAQAQVAGMPKTNDEAVAHAQFRLDHSAPGTPEHTTAQKELDSAIGNVGKIAGAKNDVKQLDLNHQLARLQEQQLDETDPAKKEALEQQMAIIQDRIQQSSKLTDRRREVIAHAREMGLDPSKPEDYNKAVMDYEAKKTASKAEGGFPTWQKRADIQNSLATERALLVQQNADANQFGLKAAELQQKGDQDYIKAMGHVNLINKALASSDASQVAANLVPLMATLNVVHDVGGISRLNKQELDSLAPNHGALTRWLSANWDRVAVGELPDNYQTEVAGLMKDIAANVNDNHDSYTKAVDQNFRQHGQAPAVTPKATGGTKVTPKATPPATPPAQGAGGYSEWRAKQPQLQKKQ